MKVLIDVRDDVYNKIREGGFWLESGLNLSDAYDAIKYGTPLPKGHGRLKDIDKVERLLDLDKPDNAIAQVLKNLIESIPTIVEADEELNDEGVN